MRKNLITLAILALASTLAAAAEPQAAGINCPAIAELAESVMGARQEGVSMAKAMKAADNWAPGEEMIRQAYARPRYNTPSIQRREAADFRDMWYATCLKVPGSRK